jgi:hypothetical protein
MAVERVLDAGLDMLLVLERASKLTSQNHLSALRAFAGGVAG